MSGVFEFLRKGGEAGTPAAVLHRRRFRAFRELLEQNNAALEIMADMEEKRSGEFLFDRAYLARAVGRIVPAVERIVAALDALSGGRYPGLRAAHGRVAAGIREALERRLVIPADGPLVLPLAEIGAAATLLAGGKMAHLGEVRNRVGLAVPEGFAVTSTSFLRFVEHNRLADRIDEELVGVRADSLPAIEEAASRLRALVRGGEVPAEVADAIGAALAAIPGGTDPAARYAVRSSAVREDGDLSFAGQYATCLNAPAAEVVARYAEVLASLFSSRAVFYCLTQGFTADEMVMAVGVVRMVDAASGGVAFSRDPNDPARDDVLVSAVRGLGAGVVDGSAAHDSWRLERATGRVLEERRGAQESMTVGAAAGGVENVPVPAPRPAAAVLAPATLAAVAAAAVRLERHFGAPQDVEWAVGADGLPVVLQSRPLRLAPADPAPRLPRRFAGREVLLDGGEIASRGAGSGPVFLLREETALGDVPAGAVLVCRTTSTGFVTVLPRLAAIVTDVGGVAGHLASLAREFGVPALLDTGTATRVLAPGRVVTVDALNGTVYAGRVEELLAHVATRREPLRDAPLVRTLAAVLHWVSPLHLTDPADPAFAPEGCRSLHDITRFAHEKAMAEMFAAGSDAGLAGGGTVPLLAGIPVGVHLLDLGGGLREGVRRAGPGDLRSAPFAALLRGMTAMRWPDPPPADAGGFLGMVARTAQIPEEELRRTAERSFAIVAADYAHFSIRLGYHFSLIEAFLGERLNDTYIRFFFKGGGAVRERRLRRVRLIADILRRLDFQVRVTDDVIEAAVHKFRRPELEAKLEALGRLTAYTKQLDMAMFNDGVADWYRDEFLRDHLPGG